MESQVDSELNKLLGATPSTSSNLDGFINNKQLPWPLSVEEETEFWKSRPRLKYVFQLARSRGASPWAVLGCVLARVIASTNSILLLPGIVGNPTSLNFFVAIEGPSGRGKDVAISISRSLIPGEGYYKENRIGSGEGIVANFGYIKNENGTATFVRDNDSALLVESEIDNLDALKSRNGSTLLPLLRDAYMGSPLGFGNIRANRSYIEAQAYRLCAILGMQADRAEMFMSGADSGTPQRFYYFPAYDITADNVTDYPEPKGSFDWTPPKLVFSSLAGVKEVLVCEEASEEVRSVKKLNRNKEYASDSDLSGHELLAKEKVAAGLAFLDDRLDISKEDWDLAEVLRRVSNRTRNKIQATRSIRNKKELDKRAHAQAYKEDKISDIRHDEDTQKVLNIIQRKITDEWQKGSIFKQAAKRFPVEFVDTILQQLVDENKVEMREKEYKGGPFYEFRNKI